MDSRTVNDLNTAQSVLAALLTVPEHSFSVGPEGTTVPACFLLEDLASVFPALVMRSRELIADVWGTPEIIGPVGHGAETEVRVQSGRPPRGRTEALRMIIGGVQADVTVSEHLRANDTYVLRVPHSVASLWNGSATVVGRVVGDRLRLREGLTSGLLAAALKEAVGSSARHANAVKDDLQAALKNAADTWRSTLYATVEQELAPLRRDHTDLKTAVTLHMECIRELEVADRTHKEHVDEIRAGVDRGLRDIKDAQDATHRSHTDCVESLEAAVTSLKADVTLLREGLMVEEPIKIEATTNDTSAAEVPEHLNQRIEAAILVQAGHERDITQIQNQILQLRDQISTIEERLAQAHLECTHQNKGLMERFAKGQADLCSVTHRFNTTYLAAQSPAAVEGVCPDLADRFPQLVGVWHGCPPEVESRLTFSGGELSGVGSWSNGTETVSFGWQTSVCGKSVKLSYADAQGSQVETAVLAKTFVIHPTHRKIKGQLYEAARLQVAGAWWASETHFVRWQPAQPNTMPNTKPNT